MRTRRVDVPELFRQWRLGRGQRKRLRGALRDERAAEELDRARSGADRFPPMGGA